MFLFDRATLQRVNYTHLFPTRYALELEGLKGTVGEDTFNEPSQREDAKKVIKKLLEERYTSGKNKWFFTALRVRGFLFEIDTVALEHTADHTRFPDNSSNLSRPAILSTYAYMYRTSS